MGFKAHSCNYRPIVAKDLLNYAKAGEKHHSLSGVWENLPFKQLSCCTAGVALCLPSSVLRGLCSVTDLQLHFAVAAREIAAAVLAPVEKHQAILRWMLSQFLLGYRWPDGWFLLGRWWTAALPLGLARRACFFWKSSTKFPWQQFPSLCHDAYQCVWKSLRAALLQLSSLVIMCCVWGFCSLVAWEKPCFNLYPAVAVPPSYRCFLFSSPIVHFPNIILSFQLCLQDCQWYKLFSSSLDLDLCVATFLFPLPEK